MNVSQVVERAARRERANESEEDLLELPEPVQRYLAFMRVDGPRVVGFRASFGGRFRMGPRKPWTTCETIQQNHASPIARIFRMQLRMAHILTTVVRDSYVRGRARMVAKLFDRIGIVDASGPELDVGELVTYLNDAILFAPSMVLGTAHWTEAGEDAFDVSLADAGRTVTARVLVEARGAPLEFSTCDRFVNDPDTPGHPFVRCRWSTPIDAWCERDGLPRPRRGRAVWHLASGDFTYAELDLGAGEVTRELAI
jgi:hypothetical protein